MGPVRRGGCEVDKVAGSAKIWNEGRKRESPVDRPCVEDDVGHVGEEGRVRGRGKAEVGSGEVDVEKCDTGGGKGGSEAIRRVRIYLALLGYGGPVEAVDSVHRAVLEQRIEEIGAYEASGAVEEDGNGLRGAL